MPATSFFLAGVVLGGSTRQVASSAKPKPTSPRGKDVGRETEGIAPESDEAAWLVRAFVSFSNEDPVSGLNRAGRIG